MDIIDTTSLHSVFFDFTARRYANVVLATARCPSVCLSVITHTHMFNGPLSRTTQVSRYQKGKTNVEFTEARDSDWQWHQLGHMQVCTSLLTDNHASTPPLIFSGWMPFLRPTNSFKALSVISRSFVKQLNGSSRFLAQRLLSTYRTLFYEKFQVSSKIRVKFA